MFTVASGCFFVLQIPTTLVCLTSVCSAGDSGFPYFAQWVETASGDLGDGL